MKILLILCLVLALTGCTGEPLAAGAGPNWSYNPADPSPDPLQVELYLAGIQSQGTLEAARLTAESVAARQTAEAVARAEAATQAAFERQAAETQAAGVLLAQASQTAFATTERAWQATATADAALTTQTAAAVFAGATATGQAWDRQATAAVSELQAEQTAVAAQAYLTDLAAERARLMNNVRAVTPYALIALTVLALSAAAYFVTRSELWRRRWIFRDARGDAPIYGDGRVFYDPDRNPGAVLQISGGQPRLPALAEPELQDRVTSRDQAIDLASRAGRSPAQQAAGLPGGPLFRILSPQERPPLLDRKTEEVLDAEWKAADQ